MKKPYAIITISPGVEKVVYSEEEYREAVNVGRPRYLVHPFIAISILVFGVSALAAIYYLT